MAVESARGPRCRPQVEVYDEARTMVRGETPGIRLCRKTRTRKVRRRPNCGGRLRPVTEVIEVVVVDGCHTFETPAPADQVDNDGHKRSFKPYRINAVLLGREDGRDKVGLNRVIVFIGMVILGPAAILAPVAMSKSQPEP